ncbi:MAG: SHOCT-like domain-containing protein [Chloroflexota bacterium]
MNEERLQILKMLQEGKITVDEAEKLMTAVDAGEPAAPAREAKWFRVRITDLKTGRAKVNVNLPVSLIGIAGKFIPKDAMNIDGKQIDLNEIIQAIKQGAAGKIVEVVDEEDEGVKIEVILD